MSGTRPGQAKGPWVGSIAGSGGVIGGSGTPPHLAVFKTASTIGDSFAYEIFDTAQLIQLDTPVGSPTGVGIGFADEGVNLAKIYRENSTQDLVVALTTVGEALRLLQSNGNMLLGLLSDVGGNGAKLQIGYSSAVEEWLCDTESDPGGRDLARIRFAGYDQSSTSLGQYASIVARADDSSGAFLTGGAGSISIQAFAGPVVDLSNGLVVRGDKTGNVTIETYDGLNVRYAFFDGDTQSLSVGRLAATPPRGLLNLVSDSAKAVTEQIVTNVGPLSASSGTFTRSGNVMTRKDVGRLTDDGVLPILTGEPFVGVCHVWASTSTGENDHVHQACFTFDSASISIYNAVGSVVTTDTNGKLCILVNDGISIKNRLGATVTIGYSIDYYDNPAITSLTWTPVENIADWRAVAMDASGNYQTAVANNGNIYRTTNKWSTWAAVAIVKPWYDVTMDTTGQYQYAIEGRDAGGGYVWISSDYGATWASAASVKRWQKIVCDSTGQYVVASVNGGSIYYSSDYGVTWAQSNAAVSNWQGLAMSGGSLVFATAYGSRYLMRSTNYGQTWTTLYDFGSAKKWDSLACSANGAYILAGEEPGSMWRSQDVGVSFAAVASLGTGSWHEVALDGTGQYATVIVKNGTISGIYRSSDYGVTFAQDTAPPSPHTWWGLAVESDTLQTIVGSLTRIYVKS